MTDEQPQAKRGKHGTWLFIVAVFLLVAAVGVSLLLPYYRQWQAVQEIEALGGTVDTEVVGPEWLHECLPQEWSSGLCRVYFVDADNVELFGDEQLGRVCALGGMSVLQLSHTRVSDTGLKHLASLSNPDSLSLDGTRIGDDGLRHLSSLSNLDYLSLDRTRISDDGLKHLSSLSDLENLHLSGTRITDVGLKHLVGLSELRHLRLQGTRISDVGLEHLTGLSNLVLLNVENTPVTPDGAKKPQAVLPYCDIYFEDY